MAKFKKYIYNGITLKGYNKEHIKRRLVKFGIKLRFEDLKYIKEVK